MNYMSGTVAEATEGHKGAGEHLAQNMVEEIIR
jgi:hypothetical protein